MAIVYYVGGKIVGLEADTKPLSVPENSTFIESDTQLEFIFVAGVWEQIAGGGGATFDFQFDTQDSFVDDPPDMEVQTGNSIWHIEKNNNGGQSTGVVAYRNLGAISNNAWTIKFKMDMTRHADPANNAGSAILDMGIGSTLQDNDGVEDFLGFRMQSGRAIAGTPFECNPIQCDNVAHTSSTNGAKIIDENDLASDVTTLIFGKIRRTSATNLRVEFFSDSGFSIPYGVPVDLTIPSTIDNLSFLKCTSRFSTSNTNLQSALEDYDTIEIFDGVPDA